jgi:VanZ family protein
VRPLRWGNLWLAAGIAATLLGAYLALRPPVQLLPASFGDKLQHALSYVAMGLWFGALFHRRHLARVALALFAFGLLIEVLQAVMPFGRAAEWRDVVANTSGIVIAMLLTRFIEPSWMQRLERWAGRA